MAEYTLGRGEKTPIVTVFVVDDEESVRITISDELRDSGYSVYEFDRASSAWEALREYPVDVVITDIVMGPMDGLELLWRIKAYNPDVDVIVMTAYGSRDWGEEVRKLGAIAYLTKPFSMDDLTELLEHVRKRRIRPISVEEDQGWRIRSS